MTQTEKISIVNATGKELDKLFTDYLFRLGFYALQANCDDNQKLENEMIIAYKKVGSYYDMFVEKSMSITNEILNEIRITMKHAYKSNLR